MYSFSEDDVIYGDIVIALLYTDFSYFSTVFFMFTPCFSMFDYVFSLLSHVWYCLSLSSPWSSACWWCPPGWLCYATYGGEVHHVILPVWYCPSTCFLCLIMFCSYLPCFPPVSSCRSLFSSLSSCWLCFFMSSLVILLLIMSLPCFLRDILMRIATILWPVWFDDCLRLPVKLSFYVSFLTDYVSVFLICSVSFSFYCYDDLIFSLFRWC